MSTYQYGEPTISQVILRKLSKRLEAKQDRRLVSTRVNMRFQAIIRFMFTLAGFALLTIAAFTLTLALGFATAGISCFVLAWLAVPSTNINTSDSSERR